MDHFNHYHGTPRFSWIDQVLQEIYSKLWHDSSTTYPFVEEEWIKWTEQADEAFQHLKSAMMQAPVLTLPDFSKLFIVEADASGSGLGAVLMQENQPIAFFNKAISGRALGRSTYKKDLMAVLHAVHKWRNYLLGRHFQIRTDHCSLKYLLE